MLTEEQVQAALLEPQVFGQGFSESTAAESEEPSEDSDSGCLSSIEDPSGEPAASASLEYEGTFDESGLFGFGSMQVESYPTVEELDATFQAARDALAGCGTETFDGLEVTISYDPELQPVTGVDDQIFIDMQASAASDDAPVDDALAMDIALSVAVVRIANNTAMLMLADATFEPSEHADLNIAAHAQTAADRLRAVMDGKDLGAAPGTGAGQEPAEIARSYGLTPVKPGESTTYEWAPTDAPEQPRAVKVSVREHQCGLTAIPGGAPNPDWDGGDTYPQNIDALPEPGKTFCTFTINYENVGNFPMNAPEPGGVLIGPQQHDPASSDQDVSWTIQDYTHEMNPGETWEYTHVVSVPEGQTPDALLYPQDTFVTMPEIAFLLK